MLKVSGWDEISGEWQEHELPIPANTKNPKTINDALATHVGEEGGAWAIVNSGFTGAIQTIECSSDRGHQGIIVINYTDQEGDETEEPLVETWNNGGAESSIRFTEGHLIVTYAHGAAVLEQTYEYTGEPKTPPRDLWSNFTDQPVDPHNRKAVAAIARVFGVRLHKP